MRSSALLATAGVLALVACTGDDPMILGDTTEGGTAPDDGGGGGGGDSTAPSTPDHRCDQGAPVDTKCQCVPGEQRACNAHAGKDGTTCKAGTQKCVLGSPPSTSAYEACSGAVDPAADDCEADGSDKDCDGVKGNGTTCTQKVYLYATEAYSCAAGSTAWPRDMYMTDAADPAGVPNAFVLVGTMKLFAAGSGTKIALHGCFDATRNQHFVGSGGCSSDRVGQRIIGYASKIDGGAGWVKLSELFGKDFVSTGLLPLGDPACGATYCGSGGTLSTLK